MPLECPRFAHEYNQAYSEHNACLRCVDHKDGQCRYYIMGPRPLSEILTTDERIAILEDKKVQVFAPRPVDKEIEQLKAMILHLQNKIGTLTDKRKDRL